MRAGEFEDGAHVLRARIDMASPNINMRDPVLYRIRRAHHHRTGDDWCIYPMYDFAHPPSDAIERITHSLCTLEFEDHRPLYDWLIEHLPVPARPEQIEFARLNLTYTVMSKRKFLRTGAAGARQGWDDPRMPTIVGMRRRGYTPEAIRAFCERIGVAKRENVVDVALLEHAVREDLNRTAPRVMGVLNPLRVVIENYPEGQSEEVRHHQQSGGRVCRDAEAFRSRGNCSSSATTSARIRRRSSSGCAPGREVRLRGAYFITCTRVIKDADGHVIELRCTYDPATRGGDAPDGRKVKATLHWVSVPHALDVEVRLYDRLFKSENPDTVDYLADVNPVSLDVITEARVEPSVRDAVPGTRYQFERLGYFCVDPDSAPGRMVFNRTVTFKRHLGQDRAARLTCSRRFSSTPAACSSIRTGRESATLSRRAASTSILRRSRVPNRSQRSRSTIARPSRRRTTPDVAGSTSI